MASKYALYDKPRYLEDLTRRIERLGRGDRVDLACMTADPSHPAVARLLDALAAAARRGIRARFLCDAINFMIADGGGFGPLFFKNNLDLRKVKPPYQTLARHLLSLRDAGATVHITNQPRRPFSLPFAGRSHMKFAVINERAYLGGCNLDYPHHVDAMAAWDDRAAADWLHRIAGKIGAARTVSQALGDIDLQYEVDATARILLDVGRRRQSIIMDEALSLIDQAEDHLYLTTQYFPSHRTAQRLRSAHARGVAIKMIYNHHTNTHRLRWLHAANARLQRHTLPAALFAHALPRSHPYVHAKILATEKGCLFGSHNYVQPGVSLGTAEITLAVKGDAFGKGLVSWFEAALRRTAQH